MTTIIAYINGRPILSRLSQYELKEACEKIGTDEPTSVYNAEKLLEQLQTYSEDEILLITNFPPNSSYPGSKKDKITSDKGDYIANGWPADSYEKSYLLFDELLKQYRFRAIHFITGAPEEIISDYFLKTASELFPIGVTRRKTLIGEGLDYEKLYLKLIISIIQKHA